MRKITAFVVVLILTIGSIGMSLAEADINFAEYSLDELLLIKENLTNEISKRPGGDKVVYGAGQYKVGVDLPSGVYSLKYVQNGDTDVSRTEYYIYENESMYKYDVSRSWLGDMPRVEDSLQGDGMTRVTLYPGDYFVLYYNGAEVERVGNVQEQVSDYIVPEGTTIPKGTYTIGEEIPAGSYNIYFSGKATSRVRVFQDFKESDNMFNDGKETVLDESNPLGMVTLSEGNVMRVEYSSIIMKKGGGFVFD